jgi:hypothetical protein
MKARRIFLFFAFLGGLASAQSDEALRFRYWKLRQKLLETYVVVGDCHGCSLPATLYDYIPGDNGHRYLSWHDETPRQLGWYIAMLATENYLLRLNNASEAKMQQNREELFYALKAIDRLDKYGEYLYCADPFFNELTYNREQDTYSNAANCFNDLEVNLNGYFIREDVPPYFEDYFPQLAGSTFKVIHGATDNGWIQNNLFARRPRDMSQDMLFHLSMGLAFCNKYVSEGEAYTFSGVSFSLLNYARTISNRLFNHYEENWILRNPANNNDQVRNDDEATGTSTFWSYLVATTAAVNGGQPLPLNPNLQLDFDQLNPFSNSTSFASRELFVPFWMGNLPLNVIDESLMIQYSAFINSAHSYGSANESMLYLLMALSGVPRHIGGPTSINGSAHFPSMLVQGHYFYGNIYRALHQNIESVGIPLEELRDKLEQIDCEGSYFYDNNEAGYKAGGWYLDNSFLSDAADLDRGDLNGHYNNIDWMFTYNLYLILSGNTSEYIDHDLIEVYPKLILPINSSEVQNTEQPFIFLGSEYLPRYCHQHTIESKEKFHSMIVAGPNESYYEPASNHTYFSGDIVFAKGDYYVEKEINLLPGFEVESGVEFNAIIAPENCPLTSGLRLANPNSNTSSSSLVYNVVNNNLDNKYRSITTSPKHDLSSRIWPNPCQSEAIIALNSVSDGELLIEIFSSDGKLNYYSNASLVKGDTQISIKTTAMPSGIYQVILTSNKRREVLRLVKL